MKELFRQEVAKKDEKINLARAALLFSACLTGAVKPEVYLARLDRLAAAAAGPVRAAVTAETRLAALNHYLFEELGFLGNAGDYYNPRNSFLDQVLTLKTGIPISLSVLYMEVGWRLRLPLWGIGMPGHFIVGYGPVDRPLYIDVFNRGRLLSEDDCMETARVLPSNRLAFRDRFLQPVSKKMILQRMLLNLKYIYLRQESWAEAYQVVDMLLLVRPGQTNELRDRGLLAQRLNRLQAAIFDLQRYLFLAPDSPETAELKQQVEVMEAQLARLN